MLNNADAQVRDLSFERCLRQANRVDDIPHYLLNTELSQQAGAKGYGERLLMRRASADHPLNLQPAQAYQSRSMPGRSAPAICWIEQA